VLYISARIIGQTRVQHAFKFSAKLWVNCLAVVLLSGCGSKSDETKVARPVMTVELVSPSRQPWADTLAASGEIAPWQEAIIGTEVAGLRVDSVLVNVGDNVKKGQLLAQFSEETLRADLAALDAAVAEADANLAKADADAQRADKLEAGGALSQQAIQVYRTQKQAAKARLDSARAQRDAQALRVRYARVVAPDAGVISSRSVTVGEVSVMGSELFRLVRRNRLEWRAEVAADALARLKPGITVTVNALDGRTISAKLRQLAPTVSTSSRNGLAYVDLPADSGLAAGMYLSGSFALASRAAVVIPESALVLRDGNKYLMQVDASRHVQEIKVETGGRRDNAIEILTALDPAAQFVKSGSAFINTGDLVQIADGRLTP